MQLARLSLVTCTLLASLSAEDYINVQYLHYQESDDRITVSSPTFEVNKDFGVDYSLNFRGIYDGISGASPTYYDASTGASNKVRRAPLNSDFGRGPVADKEDIVYDNVSFAERRVGLSALLTTRFDTRDELRVGLNWSLEYDLYLYEGSLEYMHFLDGSKNRSITFGGSYQRHVNLVPCGDYASACDGSSGPSKQISSNHTNLQTSFSQVIDQSSVASATLFYMNENGYLTNSYKNIVRNYHTDATIVNENRPESRNQGGIILEYTKSIVPELALHVNYRYYIDDWKMSSHTPNVKVLYQISNALRLDAGFRYYSQKGAYFYSGNRDAFTDETYASSDERLADFKAYEPSIGMNLSLTKEISYNLSGSYYEQSTGLSALYLITGFKYHF
ncbi:MAG: DUF3570 domain-containing protein [Campylobacterota bacterium]|nr:DUF3570 domain-containing protein [Campylobacterota bacterium]